MPDVALIKCGIYNNKKIKESVKRGFNLLGGADRLFKKDEKILLKPNLLTAEYPSKCVTTNPVVFEAVASFLLESGFSNLYFGDSPATGNFARASKKAGLSEVAEKLGVTPLSFKDVIHKSFPDAAIAKVLPVAADVLEMDAIVSISKMKTHAFTRITGAVKNQFGCIPGFLKGEFHFKMPDINDFSKMLVDINRFLKPRLYIMDGIIAMEGNGPRSGNPVNMNSILISKDPVALDSVFCRLIDMNPKYVPTMIIGKEQGLGEYEFSKIKILGDNWEELRNPEFRAVRKPYEKFASRKNFPVFLKNLISSRPVIDNELCRKCGKCVIHCPVDPKAVNWKENDTDNPPVHDYKLCIRCYCCQEICPHQAITLKTPLLGKLIKR